jgi:tetratricopeptide (TPR) repeat protein
MSVVLDKHHEAMAYADEALLARRNGENDRALQFFRQAFECERAAANQFTAEDSDEPTRSVLHRSAATLALDCGEFREAERLIGRALAGNPPAQIAQELRDLLKRVYKMWGGRKRNTSTL